MIMKNLRQCIITVIAIAVLGGIISFSTEDNAYALGNWYWPFVTTTLTQDFDTHGKIGVDVAAPAGSAIYAPTNGVVTRVFSGCNNHSCRRSGGTLCIYAGVCSPSYGFVREHTGTQGTLYDTYGTCNNGFGNGVVIYCQADNYTIQFAHMSSVASGIYEGMEVTKDTLLGYVGDCGNATGVHCHYAIAEGKKYYENFVNPMNISYHSRTDDIYYGSDMGSFGFDRTIADGNYLITNAASPADALYYLDIGGTDFPATAGTNVMLSGPLTGSLITNPPAYEIWNVKYNNSDHYYTITQYGSNGAISLDVADASVQSGANIQVYTGHSGSCQKWAIFFCDGGSYSIESKVSGWALTAGTVNSVSNITQEPPQNIVTQRWNFIPYSEPNGTLDVNGLLDGEQKGGLINYGTCDVYINNSLVANDVSDYVQSLPANTTYSISDIKAKDGYSYDGRASGSAALSGTIQSGVTTDVRLKFNSCTLTVKGLLDGTASDNLGNYGTFDLYVDGTQVKNDTNAYSGRLTKGATYEIKDIKANTGFAYKSASGSLTGKIKSGNITVRLGFDAVGTVSEDWITVDRLPGNINSTICDIEYKHTYQKTAQSSPGSGWSQVPGSGVTTYQNNGAVQESLYDLGSTDTYQKVGSYYYHYCGAHTQESWWVNYEANVSQGYTDYHGPNASGAFEVIDQMKDDTLDGVMVYKLRWRADCGNQYAGYEATCGANRSSWWYLMYQYQPRVAVTNYTWTKTGNWTTTADSAATSVTYRYRLKSSLTKLDLPANLAVIEDEAFAGAMMNAVIVPDGCTAIGSKAFANCSELVFVSVPKGTVIAADAFEGCGSVTVNER